MNVKIRISKQLIVLLVLVVTLFSQSSSAQGNEPWPFWFSITPSHEDGRITYDFRFSSRVEWKMVDLQIKIPLPKGTRYVESKAPATTSVDFDGQNIIYFTSVFHKPIRGAAFTLEITNPNQTVFDTDVLITWKGDRPGLYQLENISFDVTKTPLDWTRPRSRLLLGFMAHVAEDDTITYSIYPENYSGLRMWDLRVNVPLPTGTKFISMEAPQQFSATFDGEVAYFFTSEMPRQANLEPLKLTLSTENVPADQLLTTHAWASWKNSGRGVGRWVVSEEQITSGQISVLPRLPQQAVADREGDVPLSYFDVTSLVLSDHQANLDITYNTASPLWTKDPVVYQFFIDHDCRLDTGQIRDHRGVEYRVRYRQDQQQADLSQYDTEAKIWLNKETIPLPYSIDNTVLTISLPYQLINNDGQFCWTSVVRNGTQEYTPAPPADKTPDTPEFRLTEYSLDGADNPAKNDDDGPEATKPVVMVPVEVTGAEEADRIGGSADNLPPSNADSDNQSDQKSANESDEEIVPKSTSQAPTAKKPNQQPQIDDEFVNLGDTWKYRPGWSEPPHDWAEKGFDDRDWFEGGTTIGYGDGKFSTDLSLSLNYLQQIDAASKEQPSDESPNNLDSGPRTDFTSVFIRREFTIDQLESLIELILKIDYEDGFVAYINGVEVARQGLKAPGTPLSFDTPATDRDGGFTEKVDLSDFIDLLNEGDNVIAIEVHKSLGRSSLYVSPELSWQRDTSSTPAEETTDPTPTPFPTTKPSQPQATSSPTEQKVAQADSASNETESTGSSNAPQSGTQANHGGSTESETTTPTEGSSVDPGIVPNSGTGSAGSTGSGSGPTYIPESGGASQPPNTYSAQATPSAPAVDSNTLTTMPRAPLPQTMFHPPDTNPSIIDTHGKIAVPIDDGNGTYNVYVFTLRFGYGWETDKVSFARQPDISLDGQRMVTNHQGDGLETVHEYSFIDKSEKRVSDHPQDSHPTYDPWADRVTYGNPELIIDPNGTKYSHVVVQCSLLPPHQEREPQCQDIVSQGILIPSGQMGQILGSHPVWASNDHIIYKGCNSWVGGASCGIYSVNSWSTRAFSDGSIPTQLTDNTTDIPTDTQGNYVVFMSQRDNNWEAFIMGLDGTGMRNLSNSPASNDGLPTISPDGDWVAFISDRDGLWAVWAVPLVGGQPLKLFDLPNQTPWGTQDRSWTNERISWGP
ncbi:hypothetical protein QUF64_14435 [Anaerolineales bacterium HSG6]|nr:hypothetical protein [Anaerolineales bacterium HSG6]